MKLALRILGGAFTGLMIAMILATVALSISAKRSKDAIPSVLGHKVLTVVSGSMEPAINTGDVIIVKPLDPGESIQEGDVITFRSKEKADMLITHRVMGTVLVNDKPAAYVTKGDANESEDRSTVTPAQVIGRYQWRVPYYGYVANVVRTPLGATLLIIVPGVLLVGMEIRKMIRIVREEDAAAAAAKDATPPAG